VVSILAFHAGDLSSSLSSGRFFGSVSGDQVSICILATIGSLLTYPGTMSAEVAKDPRVKQRVSFFVGMVHTTNY
jgi:hypothetical protein